MNDRRGDNLKRFYIILAFLSKTFAARKCSPVAARLTSGQPAAIADPHEIYLLWPCSVPVVGQINSMEGGESRETPAVPFFKTEFDRVPKHLSRTSDHGVSVLRSFGVAGMTP
jgi:hypothetical protein